MTHARSVVFYRKLLRILPSGFRARHGSEMERVFVEALTETVGTSRRLGAVRAWTAAIRDVLIIAVEARWHRPAARTRWRSVAVHNPQPEKRGEPVFISVLSNLRYNLRSLRRTPGFASVAILTIGLGIGTTTLVFSVVYGVLLRPLPYDEPDRLVNIWNDLIEERQFLPAVHAADFRDYQRMSETFQEFAAGSGSGQVGVSGVLTGDGPPVHVDVSSITFNFLSLLGIDPILGRHFTPEEEAFNGPKVAIMSHALWSSRYGSDPNIVGSSIEMDGMPYTITGILPRGFRLLLPDEAFLIKHADVWVPLQRDYSRLPPRNWTSYTVLGRLKPDVTLEQAQSEMDRIAEELRATHPAHARSGMQIRLVPFQYDIVKAARPALLTLFGAVGFVLLIACANVAHLMLLRGASRQRELAVRTALGANRSIIVGQVFGESLVLGVLGAGLGLLITQIGLAALTALQPQNLPRLSELGLSGAVLGFAAAAAIINAVVFGLAPAFHAARAEVTDVLKEGGRSGRSAGATRLRNLLVVGEVAVSLVLLIGTGLMVRSFQALQQVRPGFESQHVMTFGLSLPRQTYPQGAEVRNFVNELHTRLEALPGVESVGAVSQLPLTGTGPLWPYAYDEETAEHFNLSADGRIVSPDYFAAMGTRLVAGRFFGEQDNTQSQPVTIVEEMLAQRAWPDEDPIGQQLQLAFGNNRFSATVVGVVEHTRVYDLTRDVREHMYQPHGQRSTRNMSFVVRSSVDPLSLASSIRQAIWAIDADLPVNDLRPMQAYVADAMAESRLTLLVMTGFGMLALLLASIGIYGVISYGIDQRAREFGIRIALGASPQGLVRSVLADGARLVSISIAVGLVGSLALTRSVRGLLFGVSPTDPWTYAVVSAVLFGVAILACYLPARRASGTDPVMVLRAD